MISTNTWATCSIGYQLLDPSGLGRWSGLSYLGKRGKRIAILTAYRSPCQQPKGGFGFYINSIHCCSCKEWRNQMYVDNSLLICASSSINCNTMASRFCFHLTQMKSSVKTPPMAFNIWYQSERLLIFIDSVRKYLLQSTITERIGPSILCLVHQTFWILFVLAFLCMTMASSRSIAVFLLTSTLTSLWVQCLPLCLHNPVVSVQKINHR